MTVVLGCGVEEQRGYRSPDQGGIPPDRPRSSQRQHATQTPTFFFVGFYPPAGLLFVRMLAAVFVYLPMLAVAEM
jgi:hypothetical protein